jgi:hypothetical protein
VQEIACLATLLIHLEEKTIVEYPATSAMGNWPHHVNGAAVPG